LLHGAQLHADDVGARAGLAHRERAHVLARDELRQVAALLRLGAVERDLVHAQVAVGAVREAHRSRGPRDLLHRDDVREVTEIRTAVFLGHRDA
jgi:hypothetical protein